MAGGGSKPQYDYPLMQLEYVTTDISLRELAIKHGVKSPSSVSAYARRHDWDGRRSAYKATEDDRVMEAVASKRAKKIVEMEEDFFTTVHGGILSLGLNMADRWETDPETGQRAFVRGQQISPEGLTKLIEKFLVMTGQVTERSAHLGLNVNIPTEQLPRDVLRELHKLAISKGAGTGPVGQSPFPDASGAKSVNGAVAVTVGD